MDIIWRKSLFQKKMIKLCLVLICLESIRVLWTRHAPAAGTRKKFEIIMHNLIFFQIGFPLPKLLKSPYDA